MLTALVGPVAVGDPVVVNTTAVELGLGTGGWDVVHWNLARTALEIPGGGHVMKLRYTPVQADTGVAEEADGYEPPASLGDLPVVVCTLHSQLAGVTVAFAAAAPARRLVYVMTDSAALPADLSDLAADLRAAGLLAATVSAGQAFGGDHEAVNILSALEVAVARAGAHAVVVAPGPGIVGTGSRYGHGAVEAATVVDLAGRVGARPVLALRVSDADARVRHRGLSHHAGTVLALAHEAVVVAVPAGEEPPEGAAGAEVVEVPVPDTVAAFAALGLGVTSMGRPAAEDPRFHAYAAAAGVLAASLVSGP